MNNFRRTKSRRCYTIRLEHKIHKAQKDSAGWPVLYTILEWWCAQNSSKDMRVHPKGNKIPWHRWMTQGDDAFRGSLRCELLQKAAIPTFPKVNGALLANGALALSSSMQVPQSTSIPHFTQKKLQEVSINVHPAHQKAYACFELWAKYAPHPSLSCHISWVGEALSASASVKSKTSLEDSSWEFVSQNWSFCGSSQPAFR